MGQGLPIGILFDLRALRTHSSEVGDYLTHSASGTRVQPECAFAKHRLHTSHQFVAQSHGFHRSPAGSLRGNNRASNVAQSQIRDHRDALSNSQFLSRNLIAPSFLDQKWFAFADVALQVTCLVVQRFRVEPPTRLRYRQWRV